MGDGLLQKFVGSLHEMLIMLYTDNITAISITVSVDKNVAVKTGKQFIYRLFVYRVLEATVAYATHVNLYILLLLLLLQ